MVSSKTYRTGIHHLHLITTLIPLLLPEVLIIVINGGKKKNVANKLQRITNYTRRGVTWKLISTNKK